MIAAAVVSLVGSDTLLAVHVRRPFAFSRTSSLSRGVPYLARTRTTYITISEAANPTKSSNNVYCCKLRISPSSRTEIERVILRAVPRRRETRLSPTYLICLNCPAFNPLKKYLLNIISRVFTRWNLCFHVENFSTLIKIRTFDLDTEWTHGQSASCRARPMNVDSGLEDIRWIRGLGGKRLPAASYALLPNLIKRSTFANWRGT